MTIRLLLSFVLSRESHLSLNIGHRVGLDMTEQEALELAGAFLGPQVEDCGRLLNFCYPFEEQIIDLHEKLRKWRDIIATE